MQEKEFQLVFRTAHGDRSLAVRGNESIVDACRRYGIPSLQVSTYLDDGQGDLKLFVSPHRPLAEYAGSAQVIVMPNRNIDFDALIGGRDILEEKEGASTWRRRRVRDSAGNYSFITEYLTPPEARAVVTDQVREALRFADIADEPLVVGVSGGGDSNALLGAILESGVVSKENVFPVMMLGIPDWDKGVDRATEVCESHGLSLTTVSPDETAAILGFKDATRDWVSDFEKLFPGDDLEVLGVYGVRKVLEAAALDRGAGKIVIGSNLEDCLSDLVYSVAAGRVPFPKPLGRMGKIEILYPLWLTPKGIIDGCYPKYSLANYEARYPSRMFGRAYFYYAAQMLVEAYPGLGESLLRGGSKLSDDLFEDLPIDEEFGTPVLSQIPLDIRVKLRKLFGRSATGSAEPS